MTSTAGGLFRATRAWPGRDRQPVGGATLDGFPRSDVHDHPLPDQPEDRLAAGRPTSECLTRAGRARRERSARLRSHSGVNVLVADGSVRFLSDGTDLLMLARFATRDDGGVLNID